MLILSKEDVIEKLCEYSNSNLANYANSILAKLQRLNHEDETVAEELANELNSLLGLNNSFFDTVSNDYCFRDLVYHSLLIVGLIYPCNLKDEKGEILDIIGFYPIPTARLFISEDRRHWDIQNLIKWFTTNPNQININPATKMPFTNRDVNMLTSIATREGILIVTPSNTETFSAAGALANNGVFANITGDNESARLTAEMNARDRGDYSQLDYDAQTDTYVSFNDRRAFYGY